MKNNILKHTISHAILLSLLAIFYIPAYAANGTCEISRTTAGSPPMSWDNGDNIGIKKYSVFGSEGCAVPVNSMITNVHAAFAVYRNPTILTNGLPWATYVLNISGSSSSGEVRAIVSASNVNSIGSSNQSLTDFNNVDLSTLNLTVSAELENSNGLSCSNSSPSICEDFLYFEYTLKIDYETPPQASYKKLVNRAQGLCLDVKGFNGGLGANVMLYACDGYSDQQWELPAVGHWGIIKNKTQGLCLDVKGRNGASRDNVSLYACDGYSDQQWKYLADGRIMNKTQNLCLDVQGHNGASRDNVMLFACDWYPDQEWDDL